MSGGAAAVAASKSKHDSPTIENRRARHEYHILDTLECGIVLIGSEVKSVRAGAISLGEGFVLIEGDPPQLRLHQVHIAPYDPAGVTAHDPTRPRTLLAHRREILRLARQVDAKGMTLVPLKLYFKNGFAKIVVGVARGKAEHDKRHDIAKREAQRDIDRAMSRRRQ
ncbi:MAG: SsrA-binding protein SmpB [Phycisphaeraceae bacterium]|nr:SsrA-binding protein SmpB [Phycisphaeraceae bacterium]MCW5755002.1 SsrA-binding protein SmpB [Phycisphaeraceae bacterium]